MIITRMCCRLDPGASFSAVQGAVSARWHSVTY
jgi:hypothetical protein